MKKIVRDIFISDDGVEFTEEAKCVAHEALRLEVNAVMAALAPTPKDDGCHFANGHGYIQQEPQKVDDARLAILKIAQRYVTHPSSPKWLQQVIDNPAGVDPSWPARLIGDCCPALVGDAWHRFWCIDGLYREWGQPFYRAHPERGDQIRLNP